MNDLTRKIADYIDNYPDFNELLGEATAEPFPVHGDKAISEVREQVSQIRDGIETATHTQAAIDERGRANSGETFKIDEADRQIGKALRLLVARQAREWIDE